MAVVGIPKQLYYIDNGPLDSKALVVDLTARDAIPPAVRYLTMQVGVISEDKTYVLRGGITNSDWIELGTGAGGVGTVIYSGSGVPSSGLGVNGDYYIDETGLSPFYKKTAGTWNVIITQLRGNDGDDGADSTVPGPTGPPGADSTVPGPPGDDGLDAVMTAVSATSATLGTGSQVFTYSAIPNLGWTIGMRLRAFNASNKYEEGIITAVTSTSVTILVDYVVGTGTETAWTIGVAGDVGAGSSTVESEFSVTGDGSSGSKLKLVNDQNSPGNNKTYGTDSLGVKGWKDAPAFIPDIAVYPYVEKHYFGSAGPLGLLVVPSLDRLYIPSNTTGEIRIYVASTGASVATIALASVAGVFYINSELWATNIVNGTISRYNATTGAGISAITGSGLRGVAAIEFPASNKVMFANLGSNNVTFINTSTNTVTTTLASGALGGNGVYSMCYVNNIISDHNGLVAAVLRTANEICLIDPVTESVVAAGDTVGGALTDPIGIVYHVATDKYFITNTTNGAVLVLDPASATTFAVDTLIQGTQQPFDIVQDSSTGLIYVVGSVIESTINGLQYVFTIDAATKNVVKVTPTSAYNGTTTLVNNMVIDETNGFIYTNNAGGVAGKHVTVRLKIRP